MNYDFTNRAKMITYVLMGIGLIAIIMGFVDDADRAWANLLLNNFFFLAIGLFGVFFISMQYLAQAGYGVTMKRVPEALSQYVLVAGPIMIIILALGHHHLYYWTHDYLYNEFMENGTLNPHYDKIIAGKESFLNVPFFFLRSIIYVAVWMWAAHTLRKLSLQQDLNSGLIYHNKSIKVSAVFLVFFAVTVCTSSWDWIMSIDAHWFSTIFGWYILAGIWISGTITTILLILYLKSRGYLQNVNENHLHDMGKWVLVVSMAWTYIWFSQFMLIWYANFPEEAMYFTFRIEHYRVIFFGMLVINFIFPFILMMPRDTKRNPVMLNPERKIHCFFRKVSIPN